MKKMIIAFAALLTFAACGNKQEVAPATKVNDANNMSEQETNYFPAIDRYLADEIGKQYAKGETAKQIEEGLESIDSVLDQRIIEAQEEDKANIERVIAAYESYLANADKEAESKYHDAESMREQYYQNCISTMRAASSISEYAKAKTSLMPLKGYKDADNLAEECQKEIIRLNEQKRLKEEWQAVIQKRANEEAARKRKKIVGILAVAIVLCVITVLFVTKVIMPAYVYKKEMKRLVQAEVGSTVRFGKYEQDNNTLNGKEPVEWVVLDTVIDVSVHMSKDLTHRG